MTQATPDLVVLAGPNGAGKSTFFEVFLKASGLRFVNADLIARALSPEDPLQASYQAAGVADAERRLLVEEGESFCMETVFSDPVQEKLAFLLEARRRGYRVRLVFIGLASPELSQARVIERAAAKGHDVPDEKIFSRFPRSLQNLKAATATELDEVCIFDNSDALRPFRLVARLERGAIVELNEPIPRWLEGILPG